MTRGLISNIQRFSTEDGPGIRTTIFMKGCPLSCPWCHNPEGLKKEPELMLLPWRCIRCGECIKICPTSAIMPTEGKLVTDREKCAVCGKCADVCPADARRIIGRYWTPEELLAEIEKDRVFYEKSDGGVTVSGGEGTFQPEFLIEFLKLCKAKGIHTALDTSGYVKWQILKEILHFVDLVLLDLKMMDPKRHRKILKGSFNLVLENAKKITELGKRTIIRVPIVPNYTADEKNIQQIAQFIKGLNVVERVELLPFHRMAESKYHQLGRSYPMDNVQPPDTILMEKIKRLMESYDLKVVVSS